jgi:hypothetical protein
LSTENTATTEADETELIARLLEVFAKQLRTLGFPRKPLIAESEPTQTGIKFFLLMWRTKGGDGFQTEKLQLAIERSGLE